MSGYTPGPWWYGISGEPEEGPIAFDYEAPGYYRNSAIFGANGDEVVGCGEYHVFNSPEDARLIAAAPDLLEALIDLVSQADKPIRDGKQKERIESARAAIRKATEASSCG